MSRIPGGGLLHTLLLRGSSGKRLWAALAAMATGILLLLVAVLIWWNFDRLLHGSASRDSLGSTFLTVSRRVTNDNMGRPELTVFRRPEIDELRRAPEVEDAGVLEALRPTAYMSMNILPDKGFSTVIVLESVPDRFMDKIPGGWDWKQGDGLVPVMLSSSFLSLYNYAYAPSQGLPQLSEETIKALPFALTIGEGVTAETYTAHVAGFSDRITSVLAPQAFIRHANGGSDTASASRLIVRVKDPSSTKLAAFLAERGYVTNSELMRWSKMRGVVQVVALAIGILALMLLGISLLVFVLFIELTVARARQSVQLLQEIGYSPQTLRRFLGARFIPLLLGVLAAAAALASGGQFAAHLFGGRHGLILPRVPGWPLWLCLALVAVLLLAQMRMAIVRAIGRKV